jgi:hypothetical protein
MDWLPFKSMLYHPMLIYLGKLEELEGISPWQSFGHAGLLGADYGDFCLAGLAILCKAADYFGRLRCTISGSIFRSSPNTSSSSWNTAPISLLA